MAVCLFADKLSPGFNEDFCVMDHLAPNKTVGGFMSSQDEMRETLNVTLLIMDPSHWCTNRSNWEWTHLKHVFFLVFRAGQFCVFYADVWSAGFLQQPFVLIRMPPPCWLHSSVYWLWLACRQVCVCCDRVAMSSGLLFGLWCIFLVCHQNQYQVILLAHPDGSVLVRPHVL